MERTQASKDLTLEQNKNNQTAFWRVWFCSSGSEENKIYRMQGSIRIF